MKQELAICRCAHEKCYLAKRLQYNNARSYGRVVAIRNHLHAGIARLESVRGTLDAEAPTVEHVGIDHRRLKTAVAEKLLNRTNVGPALQ